MVSHSPSDVEDDDHDGDDAFVTSPNSPDVTPVWLKEEFAAATADGHGGDVYSTADGVSSPLRNSSAPSITKDNPDGTTTLDDARVLSGSRSSECEHAMAIT